MYNTLTSLLIIIVAFGLVYSQTNTTENPQQHPYFTCSSDICNRHGQDQFCSEREKKCRNCQEIADDCLEPELPSKCTRWCINFHIQKALKNEKETACKDIGLIRNGNHNGSLTQPQVPGDVIAINCDPGYQISGSKTLECKLYGQWSHAIPTCQEIKCPVLPSVPNGRHNGSTTIPNFVGDVVTVVCNYGYERIGPELTTCSTNGVWNDQLSVCQKIQCPLLLEVENGKHNGSLRSPHVPGEIIVTSCSDLHLLLGTNSTVCNNQGFWTDPLPRCHVKECTPPPKFDNGYWSGAHHSQSPRFKASQTIHATCNEGFNLSRPVTWECLVTGDWYSHDGLYVPVCIKDEINIWMIVVCIAGGVIFLAFLSFLLLYLYRHRCKRRHQHKDKQDSGKNEETDPLMESRYKIEDTELEHLQAKPSPSRDISLHNQRLQRESQSDIKRQSTVPPSIPPSKSNEFNDGKNNCAKVENSPRKPESDRNREYSQNIPHPSNINDGSQTQRCEEQNVSGMLRPKTQLEDPPNVPSGNSTFDSNHRHHLEEQTIQESIMLNGHTENFPNISSGTSSDRSQEQNIQGKMGLNREREDPLNISRQDRCEQQSTQGKTLQNRHREDSPNIPTGRPVFVARQSCEEQNTQGNKGQNRHREDASNMQGETRQNRQRGDSPNIPSESSTVDSSQRDRSEGQNIPVVTFNINLHANNSADNSNRIEYGNKSDSRCQVPKTDNSASQTQQATRNQMDIRKDEKSPIEESGKFQSSQQQTSCETKDKLAASRSEHDMCPLNSLDSKCTKEKLGSDNNLINGWIVEQNANNEQDTVLKSAMSNDDLRTDDFNACISNEQCGGNEHQTKSLTIPPHCPNTAQEFSRMSEVPTGVLQTAVDEELGNANGCLINGLAVQQSANNEQDTARKLAMPNCDLNTDDIKAHLFNQQRGGNDRQMNNVTVAHSANTAHESARIFAMPNVVLEKTVDEELCNANGCLITGLAVQQCDSNEQDTARKLAMPNGDINADDVKV